MVKTPTIISPENNVRVIKDENSCWIWIGSLYPKTGYSQVTRAGKTRSGHTWNWFVLFGSVPDGLEIDHICRVRACINPEHLRLMTHGDNVRAAADLKTKCPQGHEYDILRTDRGHRSRRCSICTKAQTKKHALNNAERIAARQELKKDQYNANRRAARAAKKTMSQSWTDDS